MKVIHHLLFYSLSLLPVPCDAVNAVIANAERTSYEGYKVFRVPTSDLTRIRNETPNIVFELWKTHHETGLSDIMIHPSYVATLLNGLHSSTVVTMHDDLELSIAKERVSEAYQAGSANVTWFNSYHPYSEHQQWLQDIHKQYPSNSAIVKSGKSHNANDITGIHIHGNAGPGKKPAIVFHGTVHAREWISTMVTEYMIHQLLTTNTNGSQVRGLLDKYEFYIFPMVNPDGFIYSQNTTRLWRKNRQPATGDCVGTDNNRNWPYKWNGPGSSTDPCNETYRGKSHGSAPENKVMIAFLRKIKETQSLKLYIDWHSYSQLVLFPYAYSCEVKSPKYDEYMSLATGAAKAIETIHGTKFTPRTVCKPDGSVIPGSSADWTEDVIKADYSFTVELRDTGNHGFVLPPEQILPSGQEAFAGVVYMLQNLKS